MNEHEKLHANELIRRELFALRDPSYRDFHCRLMPTVDPERVIGVRTPALRKLARTLKGTPEAQLFLQTLPHAYYEENNLHGILLGELRGYEETVEALEKFLPFVDNWATCDLLSPKAFRKHPPQLPEQAHTWMASSHTYTVRFGIGVLMQFYLDEEFRPDYAQWTAEVDSEEYYIRMMQAWYFATALAKQYEAVLPYLQERRLPQWVHNKTIQKAVESFRITPEQKEYLRTLRWKK